MESNKVGKKIRDWATSLGFRLSNGSSPPQDYFALLTATPRRRQLWEAIVESIQPRSRVEQMRKQILVAKLQQNRKTLLNKKDSKQVADRIELWERKNTLENEIRETRNGVMKLERNVMARASDLLFEICKLAEIDKQLEEMEEKSLVLKLYTKREEKMIHEFKQKMSAVEVIGNNLETSHLENIDILQHDHLHTEEATGCPHNEHHNCPLTTKIQELLKSGLSPEFLWEEIMKSKKILLENFSLFLQELLSSETSVLCEKEDNIEKELKMSINQLKQKMTEKALQCALNSTEAKLLDLQIKKLEEKVVGEEKEAETENVAFGSFEESVTSTGKEKTRKNLSNYLNVIGAESYREFLKEEIKRLEREEEKTKGKVMQGRKDVEICLSDFESVAAEISRIKSKELEEERELLVSHDRFEILLRSLAEELEEKLKSADVEKTVESLKWNSRKQMNILLETPSDAFRILESSTGRLRFERESPSHCFKSYAGEFKQLLSAMLIPPSEDVDNIVSEINKRKFVLNQTDKFTSEREALAEFQRKIREKMNSIEFDSELCEKNFKDSRGILCSALVQTDSILKETKFIEKILKNWIEQPYRLMIKDVVEGKTLKECEEEYNKGRSE